MPSPPRDVLQDSMSTLLRNVLQSNNIHFPIDAFSLLRLLISHASSNDFSNAGKGIGESKQSPPHLKLSDIKHFEGMLEQWSEKWEHGKIAIMKNRNQSIGPGACEVTVIGAQVTDGGLSRKRKRGEEVLKTSKDVSSTTQLPLAATMSGLSAVDREIFSLLSEGTAKQKLVAEQHASTSGAFEPICPAITRIECKKLGTEHCDKVHFKPIIRPHTDPSLGMCSYLNTCFSEPLYSMSPSIHPLPSVPRPAGAVALPSGLGAGGKGKEKAPCRYLHYEVDISADNADTISNSDDQDSLYEGRPNRGHHHIKRDTEKPQRTHRIEIGLGPVGKGYKVLPPQWLECDLRHFDCSVLGKFHVIMADPPWDIHMSLPYGTMTDDEMRSMKIPMLQDEGLLFLWVTGRAMELGRDCLKAWGYHRIDEIVWVKTNQLQRVIRTGRTGHWLNHTKEHMLVGVKLAPDGSLKIPKWVNRGLDVDVIVSEVRETSRKPEEAYGLIERICPGGRKIEIFGRKHNTRPGWLTLGNQLGSNRIYEEDVVARIRAAYPDSTLEVTPLPESYRQS
ncbi:MT-A70-domain-containing protein [Serendipita vermifera]|nr:MT-A70-domain-containing protein [Serendipita vermifera]